MHSYPVNMVSEQCRAPCQAEDSNNSDLMPAVDAKIKDAGTEMDGLSSYGPSPQSSICRSLQHAEALLRTTFNPSLKWFRRSQSQDKDSGEEEGNFVATDNLVSRSSARVLRLQQGILGMAPQRPLVRESGALLQVCVRGSSQEGCVVQQLSPPAQQGCFRALWGLMEQRSLLLFVHEYARRARCASAYVSRLALLTGQLGRRQLNPKTCNSFSPQMIPLCRELKVHLNHWSCLSTKFRTDPFVRLALAPHSNAVVEMKRTLETLALQALVLMESYVHATLSALAQTDIESIAREELEDIFAGTELYNQLVEEHSHPHSRKCRLLQRTCYSGLPVYQSAINTGSHTATFQVKELLTVLATHRGIRAAKELHGWATGKYCPEPTQDQGYSERSTTAKWTWEHLEHNYLPSPGVPQLIHAHRPESGSSSSALSLSESLTRAEHTAQCPHHAPRGAPGPDTLLAFCEEDRLSFELVLQAVGASSQLLTPLVPHTPRTEGSASASFLPVRGTRNGAMGARIPADQGVPHGGWADPRPASDSVLSERPRLDPHQDHGSEGGPRDHVDPGLTLVTERSEDVCPTEGEKLKGEERELEDLTHRPHSVKWMQLSQSSVCEELYGFYRTLLWSACGQALWQNLHFPTGGAGFSLNLCSDQQKCLLLHTWRHASTDDLFPQECRAMLEKLCHRVLILTTHTHWDQVMCCALGSGLSDKCLPGTTQERRPPMTSPEHDGSLVMTATVKHLLQLSPPLLSAIRCHLSTESGETGSVGFGPCSLALCRATAYLAGASVQASLIWVMTKAYQFLSSWSHDKFLLITQGDLKVLSVSLERLLQQMETLIVDEAEDLHQDQYRLHRVLLRRQIVVIRSSVSELQAFSSVVLKIFSSGCKQMSGELFEQTMPSAKHWRLNYKTEYPSSPSEYVLFAAQSVIGQVLEGVAPLSDDACVQTLSVTITAFMEAWMEHILKQKIKFSIQGALQLKQDFNLIRELIQSDQYSLSAELQQQLLHLRVFQQMDSAIVCLLQQPQAKPYLQSRGWEPFRRCCPSTSSGSSIEVPIGGSITNIGNMETEVLTHSSSSPLTPDAPTAATVSPSQTYLAPSLALGAAQQEWLDLRIHNSASRWRLPGLQCLSKSEH